MSRRIASGMNGKGRMDGVNMEWRWRLRAEETVISGAGLAGKGEEIRAEEWVCDWRMI
jgi:hypothetical protein